MEARLLGRHALAADIDPLARLICRAKSTPVIPSAIVAAKDVIDAAWTAYVRGAPLDGVWGDPRIPDFPNRDYWFRPQVQRDLSVLHALLAKCRDRAVREFLLVVYSSIIVAKGPSTVANGLDIAHSRAHHVDRPTPPDVWQRFNERYRRAQKGAADLYAQADPSVYTYVYGNDARGLPYAPGSADAILTSPPYVTAIEYPRAHKFSVWWIGDQLGVSNRVYEDLRDKYIGTENIRLKERLATRGQHLGLPTLDSIVTALDDIDAERAGRARRYFHDMRLALSEMLRTLKPNRHAVIVVADSSLRGVVVPTGTCLVELAEILEVDGDCFVHVDTIERTIRERDRQLPIKRGANGSGMRSEQVIILQRRNARRFVGGGLSNRRQNCTRGEFAPTIPAL